MPLLSTQNVGNGGWQYLDGKGGLRTMAAKKAKKAAKKKK
jgi:hypothetical protein